MRTVLLAESAGFCFGVKRAVDKSLEIQQQYNKKIYTLGPLIHNNDVVEYLKENNIFSVELSEIENLNKDDIIVIRSHGIPEKTLNILKEKGVTIIDATCPFVTNIQKKVRKYSEKGYDIVILGDENHPEVIGINGWCNDSATITKNGDFNSEIPTKVCVVSQTTEKEINWKKTISNLSFKTKELLAFNTICSATEVRQKSVLELSKTADAMIIIGGKNSSNTTKLYQIAKENCKNTIHIENAKDTSLDEYIKNDNFKIIGVTAGASTPDWIIEEVIQLLKNDSN